MTIHPKARQSADRIAALFLLGLLGYTFAVHALAIVGLLRLLGVI